jgi:hypothetical protein
MELSNQAKSMLENIYGQKHGVYQEYLFAMVHMSFDIKLDKTDVEFWMSEFVEIAKNINKIDPAKVE